MELEDLNRKEVDAFSKKVGRIDWDAPKNFIGPQSCLEWGTIYNK